VGTQGQVHRGLGILCRLTWFNWRGVGETDQQFKVARAAVRDWYLVTDEFIPSYLVGVEDVDFIGIAIECCFKRQWETPVAYFVPEAFVIAGTFGKVDSEGAKNAGVDGRQPGREVR